MSALTLFVTFLLAFSKIILCFPQTGNEKKMEGHIRAYDVLNVCLESTTHKKEPGAEEDLIDECSPWRKNACCTPDTVKKAHEFSLYAPHYDMCPQKKMSERCKTHFIRDTCFYECSPNIGPWKEEIDAALRKQRFRDVPLCYSECSDWFNACAEDYTCADNWTKNYDNLEDNNNQTHFCEEDPAKSCKPIKDMFEKAENFCEKIWDYSWKVVNDSEPCMKLSFDSEKGNPNNLVADKYAYEKYGRTTKEASSSAFNISVPNNTLLFLIIIYISCSFIYKRYNLSIW